jgi:two-component system, chemotaxis family, protein-glutamate methylesterase/glutaminase
MPNPIRVLIVDDSTLVRQALNEILSTDPEIEVIGEARNGKEGHEKALSLRPDVITLDITMPVMDGLEATEKIMEEVPTPIVIVSSRDVKVIVKALGFGAMDFVASTGDLEEIREELLQKVKIASRVKPIRRMHIHPVTHRTISRRDTASCAVALGISTGGPQALQILLSKLPAHFPASILVVQHISTGFIQGLVEWLSVTSPLSIRVAKAGDSLKNGTVFFAPDGVHMTLSMEGKIVFKEDVTKKMLHVPSIDVLMRSVAEVYQESAVGVIMTGMGRDGVDGIGAIKSAGGRTIAQDEKTSAIYGMNKIAVDQGVIDSVLALDQIAEELVRIVR